MFKKHKLKRMGMLMGFLLGGISPINAQQPDYEWFAAMGGTGDDFAYSITVDNAGDVLSTGMFTGTADFDPDPGFFNTFNLVSVGFAYGAYVQKLDEDRNLIWAAGISGDALSTVESYSITTDGNNDVYITGMFAGTVDFDPGPGFQYRTGTGVVGNSTSEDIFVLKLDANGNFLWVGTMGSIHSDGGRSVATDAAGNVYVAGDLSGFADMDPGPGFHPLNSPNGHNVFVLKLDVNGNFIWVRRFKSNHSGYPRKILVDANNDIYCTGNFAGNLQFPGAGWANLSGGVANDYFLVKFDANANVLWARGGGTGIAGGFGMGLDGSGNIITAGGFEGTRDGDPGPGVAPITSLGLRDAFVQKIDPNGQHIWTRTYGGVGDIYPHGVAADASDEIYITGAFWGTVDLDPGTGVDSWNVTNFTDSDAYLQKLDANGDFIWSTTIGGNNYDMGFEVAVDPLYNLYYTGYYQGFAWVNIAGSGNTFLTDPHGALDSYVIKYDQCLGADVDAGFTYNIICTPGQEGILEVTGEVQPGGANPYHQFTLHEYPCNTTPTGFEPHIDILGWNTQPPPLNPYTYSDATQTFNHTLEAGKCYYVKRGLWNDEICLPWTETRQAGILGPVIPAVSITATSPACIGTAVTFQATPVNGGTNPIYQWSVNGGTPVTGTNVFTSGILNNGDIVTCTMSSSLDCVMPIAVSTTFDMQAFSPPSVSIEAFAGACGIGSTDLTANATGVTPITYDWNNGVGIGTTFPNTGAGPYTVEVTDGNGCTASASVNMPFVPAGGYGGIDFDQIAKRTARLNNVNTSDRHGLAYFGNDVDISNNRAIVGAYENSFDANGGNAMVKPGAAYVFEKGNNWAQANKLVPTVRFDDDFFGSAVGISGDVAVVGAKEHDRDATLDQLFMENAGAAYIFERDMAGEWNEVIKLVPENSALFSFNDRVAGDNFGTAVAIDGNNVVVASPYHRFDPSGAPSFLRAGAVFVFNRNHGTTNSWAEVQKITSPNPKINGRFGHSVAIHGDYLIIGAPYEDGHGKAYVYELSGGTWGLVAQLLASDLDLYDEFGWSVDITSDGIGIVGAHIEDAGGKLDAGSAYIYDRDFPSVNDWGERQKISASDKDDTDYFGESVAISSNYIVVGARSEDHDESGSNQLSNSGSGYIFEWNGTTWVEVNKITAADRNDNDFFGEKVAISGNNVVIGALQEDHDESGGAQMNNSGSVYFYEGDCLCNMSIITVGSTVCRNQTNGTASVFSITGGDGPYTYFWPYNGATTQGIGNLGKGSYTVIVTDANGCTASGEADVIKINCNHGPPHERAAIAETNGSNAVIKLHPNPASEQITFVWETEDHKPIKADKISILDITGKVVKKIPTYSNTIVINDLAPGVYLLQLHAENISSRMRFIKQ
jgi:hypothetical protein